MQKPKSTYALSGSGIFLSAGLPWMLEQVATTSGYWGKIPFGWLLVSFLFFLAGQLIQDLFNESSWIRVNWRTLNKLFEVVALRTGHHRDEPERLSIIFLIKYIREIKNGTITVTVRPQNYKAKPFVVIHKENINSPAYTDNKITVCILRVPRPRQPPIHSLWGEEVGGVNILDHQQTIVPGSKNLITVEVKNKLRTQRYEFFLDFENPCSGNDLPYVHLMGLDEAINVHR